MRTFFPRKSSSLQKHRLVFLLKSLDLALPLFPVLLSDLQPVLSTPYTVQGDGPAFPCSSYDDPTLYGPDGLPTFRPLIIAHRGASGMFPEHTALAYREAARQGADLIECDLAITKVKLDSLC